MYTSLSVSLALALLSCLVSAANHQIVVGGAAGLVYTPSNITAAVGDTVEFLFQARNHSVTQSSFASPCTLLQNATTKAVGFDSGYVPVAANATQVPAWTLEITSPTPIWGFCAQASHCSSGMVFAINAAPSGNKSFEAYLALAKTQQQGGVSAAGAPTVTGGSSGLGAVASGSISSASVPAAPSSSDSSAAAGATTSAGGTGGALSFKAYPVVTLLSAVAFASIVLL